MPFLCLGVPYVLCRGDNDFMGAKFRGKFFAQNFYVQIKTENESKIVELMLVFQPCSCRGLREMCRLSDP